MNIVRCFFCRSRKVIGAAIRAVIEVWVRYQNKGEPPFELRDVYSFDDNRKKSESLLIVLAGYKDNLWDVVLDRIVKFAPSNLDVCVITSGLVVTELKRICNERGWSYLATERNCLTLSQNIAINLHPDAKWIYKIDEDVFLTEGFFSALKKSYALAARETRSEIGMVAPLLNVNGYCYVKILERMGKVSDWEKRFGALYYTEGLYQHTAILKDPNAAKFMWQLGRLDDLNEKFAAEPQSYSISPYRFSIGAIMFTRDIWLDMGMFNVSVNGSDLGRDEEQLCVYCLLHSKAKIICENSYVGHLAFGPQGKVMMDYYLSHKEQFCVKE